MSDLIGKPRKPDVILSCGDCVACCERDIVTLYPEQGDDIASYDTVGIVHPLTGKAVRMLQRADDGACIYLDREAGGCSIWDRRPVVCRTFDCRLLYFKIGAAKARKGIANGTLDADVMEAGRKRLRSMVKDAEQQGGGGTHG